MQNYKVMTKTGKWDRWMDGWTDGWMNSADAICHPKGA